MRVIDSHDGVLTGTEVAHLLKLQVEQREHEKKKNRTPDTRRSVQEKQQHQEQQAAALAPQLLTYLEKIGADKSSRDDISEFSGSLKAFQLTKAEIIQIVNFPPRSLVEVHLVVEECEERLSNAQRRQLLAICRNFLDRRDE